ncbi:limonene-1,2-epoxide hydrolase family protein [Novosphingobium malaysiense]|uniref:Limonene-1,2-epoxide hydrolase domain-containing protein n=1 Tax=Novosphingobium malaysiense TaxID=1348853 RepID=A0A0B1ZN52_9SPHN|nr:limonene-1,2-epoxide hydrolase family protein [Novosphingobium malaysiense]KHK92011.1 hypothetical protein LK12_12845 [Novosphingobium malaysiense]
MTPTQTVLAFLAELEKPEGFEAGVRKFFTPTTRYLNVGMSDTTGVDETVEFVRGFEAQTGISYMIADMLAIAEDGNKVLTERIDKLYAADGTLVMAPPVMGIFETGDGKITGWRDYFDTLQATGGQAPS